MEMALAKMDGVAIDGDAIIEQLRPKDDLTEKYRKYQCKYDTLQDVLVGCKSADEIGEIGEWLKSIRKVAQK